MKINPVKIAKMAVRRNAKPINKAISMVEMAVGAAPAVLVLIKFLASRPGWLLSVYRETRRVGLYEFTDRSGATFNILLEDAQADSARNADNHSARQFVLNEVKRCVAAEKGSAFLVPDAIYLWGHPSKGFKRTAENGRTGFRRIRDATKAERTEFSGKLLRRAFGELLDSYAAA